MVAESSARRLICICLIVAGHIALIAAFRLQQTTHTNTVTTFSNLQFITLTKPMTKPVNTETTKPTLPNRTPRSPIPPTKTAISSSSEIAMTPERNTETKPEPITEPRLDLDALRASAVNEDMKREKSPIERLHESNLKNHSFEAKVENATTKAQRDDCRTAYSGAGLFAPLMVAADLIRDKGCKF